ncbi:MAG: histidine phosphatase family protein [Neisseria sp.]|uniref:histidine phosphatase family protein n=1 Tax=Neisseria sp. TaxID=192066 RepID=UPI0026DD70DA|nr:histidine phosphatase family protein [Neisseria sp.]MDO4640685.1 histidine phosphatase family protein [Neisseria sp.]
MALEVYLVRHGKTVFNTTGRLQGWSDSPLTPEGCDVAARLGRGLAERGIRFDAAFSSTAPRAAETARIILANALQSDLSPIQLPDLREYCFGGLEGELNGRFHEIMAAALNLPDEETWLQAYRNARHHLLAETVAVADPLGLAENEARFVGRLKRGMAEVAEKSSGLSRVLVVSHGMSITAILKSIDFDCIEYRSVDNASVSRLLFDGAGWQIESIGETAFLSD